MESVHRPDIQRHFVSPAQKSAGGPRSHGCPARTGRTRGRLTRAVQQTTAMCIAWPCARQRGGAARCGDVRAPPYHWSARPKRWQRAARYSHRGEWRPCSKTPVRVMASVRAAGVPQRPGQQGPCPLACSVAPSAPVQRTEDTVNDAQRAPSCNGQRFG
jgi:hypothetical protein